MNKFLALGALTVFGSLAHASIIVSLVGTPTPVGSNFAFNYQASLSGDERLDPAQTNGATCPGPSGTKVVCNPAGTFFTIYDFAGFQTVSATPANWMSTIQFTGVTPSTILGTSFDSPAIANVTFFYTGPVVHGNTTGVVFSGFQLTSNLSGINPNGNFTSQSTKDTGDASGDTDQVQGPLSVPRAANNVPEPATIGLIGLGLLGLAAVRRKATR